MVKIYLGDKIVTKEELRDIEIHSDRVKKILATKLTKSVPPCKIRLE